MTADTPWGDEPTGQEIAVVGLSARAPGATDYRSLWSLLHRGAEGLRDLTDDDLARAGIDPTVWNQPGYVRRGGVLDEVAGFDAGLFGFSAAEAERLDPQTRLLLELAWEALEDAGLWPRRFDGRVGVFAGASASLAWQVACARSTPPDAAALFEAEKLWDKDFAAQRVAYALDLRGPAVTVATACSTSLTAVHLACQALLAGDCEAVLAGGVSVAVPHTAGYQYQEGMVASPDGHCRAFDTRAQGTLRGNGGGLVLLRLLEDARADGDSIRAVIRGTAANNDGRRKVGFSAPSVVGQAGALAGALAVAGVEPRTVTCIEAHGTGTPLGDPVEMEGLRRVYDASGGVPCRVGSIKSNIGHLDAAAGVLGLIKVVLALRHATIPASLHVREPSPLLGLEGSRLSLARETTPWESGDGPRRAAVSSFGIGGTNIHAVLQEAPLADPPETPAGPWLFPLSAATAAAVRRRAEQLAGWLDDHPELALADVGHTLIVGRPELDHRLAVVAGDPVELGDALRRRRWMTTDGGGVGSIRGVTDRRTALENAARQWVAGATLDWDALRALDGDGAPRRVALPTYPFERTRTWAVGAAASRLGQLTGDVVAPIDDHHVLSVRRWLHEVSWSRGSRLETSLDAGKIQDGITVVLADDSDRADPVVTALREAGDTVIVLGGEDLPDGDQADLRRVLVTRSLGAPAGDVGAVIERGVLGLCDLARSLRPGGVTVAVITRGACDVTGDEALDPAQALIGGPVLSLPQEVAGLDLRQIDLDAGDLQAVAPAIARDVHRRRAPRLVAYRAGHRWVRRFLPLADDPSPSPPEGPSLRPGGVYLVLGGTGRLGSALAGRLLRDTGGTIVLTSRRGGPMPPDVARAGGVAEVRPAEGAAAIAALIEDIRRRHGRLDGVIHAAGTVTHRLLQDIDRSGPAGEQLASLVAARSETIEGLMTATEDGEGDGGPDWIVLCSSLSTVLGGPGYALYGAMHQLANTAAAAARRRGGPRWMVVHWDAWARGDGSEGIDGEQGGQVLRRVLDGACPHVAVSRTAIGPRLARWVDDPSPASAATTPRAPEEPTPRTPRPDIDTPYRAPGNETESAVAAVWEESLGLQRVGIDDDFFDLGGDSLQAIALLSALQRELGVAVPTGELTDRPTVRAVASFLDAARTPRFATDEQVVFGRGGSRCVFAFPPYLCFALSYLELSRHLGDVELVAFNVAAGPGIVGELAAAVDAARPDGALTLMGYSAGGRVAYAVARHLEAAGCAVSDLVLLDACARWKTPDQFDEAIETARAGRLLDEHAALVAGDPAQLAWATERLLDYSRLVHEIVLDDPLAADIHLIHSTGQPLDEHNADWVEFLDDNSWAPWTTGEYREIQGSGDHMDMLLGPHLPRNAERVLEALGIGRTAPAHHDRTR